MFLNPIIQAFNFTKNLDVINLTRSVITILNELQQFPENEQSINASVQAHPLGFLCVKWDIDSKRSLRIHVWDKILKSTQIPNWPIHDHIFSFRSVVLEGVVQNKSYQILDVKNKRTWNIFKVAYENNISKLIWANFSKSIKITGNNLQVAGTHYDIKSRTMHRSILRKDFAITVLATTKDGADLIPPLVIGDNSISTRSFNRILQDPNIKKYLIEKCIQVLTAKNYMNT